MATGSRSDAFHLRGHHVQHAHGRRMAMATEDSHLDGCMIALMPTTADANRLALKGGEIASDLHCTLFYLGPDAAVFDDSARSMIVEAFGMLCHDLPPVESKIFGISHWNAGSDKPFWVWSVGDGPEGPSLEAAHEMTEECLLMCGDVLPEMPEQHTPWVAHICAAYTDDLTLAKELEKRNGPVTFDRVRISFGDQDTDIPLTGGMMAAGVLSRELTAMEQASKADFHVIDHQWTNAVGSFMVDYAKIQSEQLAEIREQITFLVDKGNLGALPNMVVDTGEAERLLIKTMSALAQKAGQEMQAEAERQGVTVPDWDLGLTASAASDAIREIARLTSRNLSAALVQSAAKAAAPLALAKKAGSAVASAVDAILKKLSLRPAEKAAGDAMSAVPPVAGSMARSSPSWRMPKPPTPWADTSTVRAGGTAGVRSSLSGTKGQPPVL
jgi:nucleotide-binding universal stress UspA family protein